MAIGTVLFLRPGIPSIYPEPSFSVKSIGMKRMRWNRRKRILGTGGGEEKAQIDSLARGDVLSILYIQ
jgi:hypothetical protein